VKIYVDLWIKTLDDKTIAILKKLNYRAVAYEGEDVVESSVGEQLIIVRKKVIAESNKRSFLNALKGVRQEKVLVSVKPLSVDVARTAAHDSRVDTIIIDRDTAEFIDKAQLSLMKQFSKPLELPLREYLSYDPSTKAIIYRRLQQYLAYTKQPLIISSKASNWFEVFSPKSLISLTSILLGVDHRTALLYITTYPRELLANIGVNL